MIYPSADKIEANIESKYELVILAAKRCRQIREGSRPRVETDSENPLTIALEEIAAGVIKGREDKSSLAGQDLERVDVMFNFWISDEKGLWYWMAQILV